MSPKRESDEATSTGEADVQGENANGTTLHETTSHKQHDITSLTKEPSSTRKRVVLEIELTSEANELLAATSGQNGLPTSSDPAVGPEISDESATISAPVGIQLIQNTLLRMLDTQFHQLRQTLKNTGKIHEFRQRLQRLSPREFDVLMLILQGRSRKEVASILGVGFATAAKHQTRIFTKLNVRTSVELIHILSAMCVESCAIEINTPTTK